MRPILNAYASGDERRIMDVRNSLAAELCLDDDDLSQRTRSGTASSYNNAVGWATTYLCRTGLLERRSRGVYAITARGRDVFAQNPDRVDFTVLRQFPEFTAFREQRSDRPRRARRAVLVRRATERPS
jgi:restriction system protein